MITTLSLELENWKSINFNGLIKFISFEKYENNNSSFKNKFSSNRKSLQWNIKVVFNPVSKYNDDELVFDGYLWCFMRKIIQ